jgi:hypothetical protein
VIPLHIDYKGTRIKQYHKEGQALRTETTINNTRDFYIGKSLKNLPALLQIDFQANRRLLQIQTITYDCILAEETFQQLNHPRIVDDQRVSALRFADKTVQALWNALLTFDLLPAGFSNLDLRPESRRPARTLPGLLYSGPNDFFDNRNFKSKTGFKEKD